MPQECWLHFPWEGLYLDIRTHTKWASACSTYLSQGDLLHCVWFQKEGHPKLCAKVQESNKEEHCESFAGWESSSPRTYVNFQLCGKKTFLMWSYCEQGSIMCCIAQNKECWILLLILDVAAENGNNVTEATRTAGGEAQQDHQEHLVLCTNENWTKWVWDISHLLLFQSVKG